MSNIYGYDNLLSDDSLQHYGVKGQKWGVRKYQNPDGTLTDLGRKRYGGEKAKRYKQAEIDLATRRRDKAISKHDTTKANKYNRQIQALNKMTEKDVVNEELGLVQAGSKAGMLGAIGAIGTAAYVIPKTRRERSEIFAKDYKDMTIEEMKKKYNS